VSVQCQEPRLSLGLLRFPPQEEFGSRKGLLQERFFLQRGFSSRRNLVVFAEFGRAAVLSLDCADDCGAAVAECDRPANIRLSPATRATRPRRPRSNGVTARGSTLGDTFSPLWITFTTPRAD
jgi:hypothetical protein